MKRPWKSSAPAEGNARPRTRTGHQSIRGLRISGPVPIPTPMDDEFPIRNPGTNIASPLRADVHSPSEKDDEHFTAPPPAPRPPSPPAQQLLKRANTDLATAAPEHQNPTGSGSVAGSSMGHKVELPAAVRNSTASADVHIGDAKNRPQRKQSTLRGALGKLFGRRKKSYDHIDSYDHTESQHSPASARAHTQHQSGHPQEHRQHQPRRLEKHDHRARYRPFPGAESKRTASLPITEFDRALRSHSVRPEDVKAIESARNSLSAEFGLSQARKLKEEEANGLSPRPASIHGRESKQGQYEDDPEQIGRAITSDFTGIRRRSRSLSGLPEAEEDRVVNRRRSDEIRYWRGSHGSGFPILGQESLANPEEDEDGLGDDEKENECPPEEENQPRSPLVPFQFDTAAMHKIGGMKITQVATMQTRIHSLEDRVHRLEYVLNQVCDAIPEFHPDMGPPSQPALLAGGGASVQAEHTEDDLTDVGCNEFEGLDVEDLEKSTLKPDHSQMGEASSNRPTSTATIKGVIPPEDTATVQLTADHYANLLALIHTERSAREALEAQVKRLGYQVSILSKPSTYFDPPPTAKSFGDRSAFDHDDEDGEYWVKSRPPPLHAVDSRTGDESEYSDIYETPLEERPYEERHGFGAFGEDLEREQLSQKKSARTLSLSQLTHVKKIPEA